MATGILTKGHLAIHFIQLAMKGDRQTGNKTLEIQNLNCKLSTLYETINEKTKNIPKIKVEIILSNIILQQYNSLL